LVDTVIIQSKVFVVFLISSQQKRQRPSCPYSSHVVISQDQKYSSTH